MNVLLDTCCVIWAVSQPSELSRVAASTLTDEDTGVFVSAISCAEVACLADRGRIELDRHWKTWFNENLERNGWESLDITLDIVQEAYSLPGTFHADPADRIITATARINDLVILTADQKILSYPHVTTLW